MPININYIIYGTILLTWFNGLFTIQVWWGYNFWFIN